VATLLGRHRERAALDQLTASVRSGSSRALVLRGEAGVGKTSLLDYVAGRASGCAVARAAGVESEMELAFAGLQQLCAPFAERLERLPAPQADALGAAFGLRSGAAPERLVVGLAVLGLLSSAAEERPLVCTIDDAQWLDAASASALAIAARRLGAESVGLVFAVREPSAERQLEGLPELVVQGLEDEDAARLLEAVVAGPLDERVRDRIVVETRGNPLALIELPRGRPAAELAGGFGMTDELSGRIEDRFGEQLAALPAAARTLLLVAAADPTGDPLLVYRAAAALDVDPAATVDATAAGLVEVGAQVRFRHPLVRSAVYRAAEPEERRRVHRALAGATEDADPDRRAWHRAQAATGLDEDVAAELERSAARAQARGGLAAGAAFHERAAELTPDPRRRAQRELVAAQSKHQAGAPDAALRLLAAAQAGPLDALEHARAELLRAQISFATTRGRDAPPLLLAAARRLEPLDAALARETYLDAFAAALSADRLVREGSMREVAAAVLGAGQGRSSRASDRLLEGLSVLTAEGYAAAAPALRAGLRAFREEPFSEGEELRWLWLACQLARALCDDAAWDDLSARQVELARRTGAFALLPVALEERLTADLVCGRIAAAESDAAEAAAVVEATRSRYRLSTAIALANWRGRDAEAQALIEAQRSDVLRRGEGLWLREHDWGTAVCRIGLGRYDDALAAAERAADAPAGMGVKLWVFAELIEAAVRSGQPERATGALPQLGEIAAAGGTQFALGVYARSRAILGDGDPGSLYEESIERLGHTRTRMSLARSHLVYGEWLRREQRRTDAREQLGAAYEMFTQIGADAFAERARRELVATGATVRRRSVDTRDELTAQESQIARRAASGQTNAEIGAQLFLSPRTVEWHLRHVFDKLGIASRKDLPRVQTPSVARAAGM
jgi:DNA-binding CsgD family transcriptional regulator